MSERSPAGSSSEPSAGIVRRAQELPKIAAALAVLGGTTAIAAGSVPAWEERVFERVNALPEPLAVALWAPMQLGSLFGPAIVGIGAWVTWRRWRPAVGAAVCGVVAWQLAKVVKNAVERGRPTTELEQFLARIGTPTDGLGFVSGHSAVAFALAGVLSPYLTRPWRWTAYGIAALVAVARIHIAAHLPLDTVGGAALGLAVAWAYHAAVGIPGDTPGVAPAGVRHPPPIA